jgi:hypothetical protein
MSTEEQVKTEEAVKASDAKPATSIDDSATTLKRQDDINPKDKRIEALQQELIELTEMR